jgi:hypothetical protein
VDNLDPRSAKIDFLIAGEKIANSEKLGKDRHDQETAKEFLTHHPKQKIEDQESVIADQLPEIDEHDKNQGKIINVKV